MKNFVQKGDSVVLAAPHAVASGDPALVGVIFGVALLNAAQGESVAFSLEGVFELPAVTAEAVDQGQRAYYDPVARKITEVSTNNTAVGAFVLAKLAGASVATVRLDG